jgi:cell division protein FtsL
MEEGGVKHSGPLMLVVAVALLLAGLSLVSWRQSRARETLAELDGIRREISLMTAERNELLNRIQSLESLGRVVPEAEKRLGMRLPSDGEIVLLARTEP